MRRLLRFLLITVGALAGLIALAALALYGISEMQLRKTYAEDRGPKTRETQSLRAYQASISGHRS